MKKNFIHLLQNTYKERLARNPRYSLRSYAKNLNVHHATLSSILRGVRPLSESMAIKLGSKLGISASELQKNYILDEHYDDDLFKPLSLETMEAMKLWYYDAIIELGKTHDFQDCPNWICKRLGINEDEAQTALSTLHELDLLNSNNTSLLVKEDRDTLKNLQNQLLERSIDSLNCDPISIRDHSSMTMAIDTKDIEEAKEMIKNFRRKLDSRLQTKDKYPNEVYQLCISFFPLSKQT